MFKTRLLSGIVLVILAIILIVTGGDVLLFFTYIISCIGMFELYRIFKIEKSLLAYFSYAALLVFYCSLRWQFLDDKMLLFMGYMIMLMFVYVLSYPKYRAKQLMASFFGLFYVGVMLSYVYQIRTLNNGLYLAFLIFLCSWGCDTCAYCVGILIGKHKMAPVLSPKKSIEGLIGGIVGAGVFGAVFGILFDKYVDTMNYAPLLFAVVGAVGALPAVIGDLAASAIKRNNDIKDYGKLIPGHGGILDRFDSIIFTAPIIYYLLVYLL